MFDRFIDVAIDFIELFRFWIVVDEYERGVVLTWGKRRKWRKPLLGPGFHFVLPLGIDRVLVDNVVPAVLELSQQSLTTKDGEPIVLTAVVTWSIDDVEKILLAVENADSALEESSSGIIGDMVAESSWQHIHANGFAAKVTRKISTRANAWGIHIHSVQFKDLSKSISVRLWTES